MKKIFRFLLKKKVKIESKWESKNIGEIIFEQPKSKIKVGTAKDSKNGNYHFFTSGEKVLKFTEYLVDKENIYLSTGGNAIVKYYNGKASYSTDTFVINSKDENVIKTKFLYSILESVISIINTDYFAGVGLKHLQKTEFRNIKIPLPPKDIQEKIVSEVELLEKKEQKAIEEIEKLKESIYSILFKYPKGLISEICNVSVEKENPQNNLKKEYTYLGLEHIESNTGRISVNKELGGNILSTKNIFEKGNVLYGKLRPYLNKVAEPQFSGICSTDILVLKTDIPKILKYLLLSDNLVNQTSVLMKGVSLPRIGIKDFLSQKIPLPPIEAQQKIVSEIEKIETKITALAKEIIQIPQQKEAVLKKYL